MAARSSEAGPDQGLDQPRPQPASGRAATDLPGRRLVAGGHGAGRRPTWKSTSSSPLIVGILTGTPSGTSCATYAQRGTLIASRAVCNSGSDQGGLIGCVLDVDGRVHDWQDFVPVLVEADDELSVARGEEDSEWLELTHGLGRFGVRATPHVGRKPPRPGLLPADSQRCHFTAATPPVAKGTGPQGRTDSSAAGWF